MNLFSSNLNPNRPAIINIIIPDTILNKNIPKYNQKNFLIFLYLPTGDLKDI